MRLTSKMRFFLAIFAIAVYLFFSLVHLELPGLYYDEVLFANAAMGNIDASFITWEIQVGGRKLPMMLMSYIGAVKAYLYAPIFAQFGSSVATVRLPVVLLGLLTLFFTYAFVTRLLEEGVALLALLLLASDPTFIFSNKLDWGPVALMMLFKTSSLYMLWRWLSDGKLYLLGIASFLLGLGVYDKVIFLWFVAAVLVAFPLCYWEKVKSKLGLKALAIALVSFLMGCLPLVAFNLKSHGATFVNPNTIEMSPIEDFLLRCSVLLGTLNGTAVYSYFNNEYLQRFPKLFASKVGDERYQAIKALFDLFRQDGTYTVLALVVAWVCILILWRFRLLRCSPGILFVVAMFILITFFIFVTPGATGIQHFMMLYPLPQILIAFVLCHFYKNKAATLKWAVIPVRVLCLVLTILLIFSQVLTAAAYLRTLANRGGVGIWSDAIYGLAQYTKGHENKLFVLMDWGLSNQLLVLTEGKIKKEEAFASIVGVGTDKEKMVAIRRCITRPDVVLVFHAERYEIFPMLDMFNRSLEKYALEARLTKTFYQRDGQPVYLLYEVLPPPAK